MTNFVRFYSNVTEFPTNWNHFLTACDCNEEGSTSLICDKETGQCPCKANVTNQQCEVCESEYKGHPDCIRKIILTKDLYVKTWVPLASTTCTLWPNKVHNLY